MGHITEYLAEIQSAGSQLSEQHMCNRFAHRILCGLLGYSERDFLINPSAGDDETGEGIPDISVIARQGEEAFPWIVAEAKLRDELIRDEQSRRRLWSDKRKYVSASTVYFLWIASKTIIVCSPSGELLCRIHLEDCLVDESPGELILSTTDDDRVRQALEMISADAAGNLRFLEFFRDGHLTSRYLEVTRETVDHLTDTLRLVVASLRAQFSQAWQRLRASYSEYCSQAKELEEHLRSEGSLLTEHQAELRRERLRRSHAQAVHLFEYAFPDFCEQQAYTHWEPETTSRSEDEALADIFRTNAAYVVLGRLLFVRFAEDQTDEEGGPYRSFRVGEMRVIGGATL